MNEQMQLFKSKNETQSFDDFMILNDKYVLLSLDWKEYL
jgi:hypothetical protein